MITVYDYYVIIMIIKNIIIFLSSGKKYLDGPEPPDYMDSGMKHMIQTFSFLLNTPLYVSKNTHYKCQ